jgi:hypothetical protein
LNLYSKESANVKIYLPSKVVKAKEYIVKKDTKEEAKNKAKEARKVQ